MVVFKAGIHAHLPVFLVTSPTHFDRNEVSEERNVSLQIDNEKYSQTAPSHTLLGVYRSC